MIVRRIDREKAIETDVGGENGVGVHGDDIDHVRQIVDDGGAKIDAIGKGQIEPTAMKGNAAAVGHDRLIAIDVDVDTGVGAGVGAETERTMQTEEEKGSRVDRKDGEGHQVATESETRKDESVAVAARALKTKEEESERAKRKREASYLKTILTRRSQKGLKVEEGRQMNSLKLRSRIS